MIALLSAFLLLAAADLTKIYENGAFDAAVGLWDAGLEADGHTMRVYFNPRRCLQTFFVRVSEETPVTVQTVIGSKDGKYVWGTIGRTILSADNQEIPIEDAPHCVARFRISIEKGSFLAVTADAELAEAREKRGISCTYAAANQWPNTCKSSSAGTKCLMSRSECGCADDGDCFADVSHPFCDLVGDPTPPPVGNAPGTCVKCTNAPGSTSVLGNGYACRLRFPSKYYADNSLMTGVSTPGYNYIQFTNGEQIPLQSFFKELCISGSNSGACERCDQASSANIPDNGLTFPNYPQATPLADALRGSYFCKNAYNAASPHPQRPMCISAPGFTAAGLDSVFSTYGLTMEIGAFGTGTQSVATGAPTATDPATRNVDTLRGVDEWEGACGPCVLKKLGGGADLLVHTFCSLTQATTPICDAIQTNGCRACANNAECAVQTASCLTDGSGSCTGGKNCQNDGSCKTCTSNADCGPLDGGENKLQGQCDTASGQCIDAFSCTGNALEGTAKDCSLANGGNNCQKGGTCKTCLSNADCGTTDGGTTQNQQVCNIVTGTCGPCTLNSNCVGTSGANCQKDGSCIDCTATTVCGTTDGGAITPACVPSATVYCADLNDQTICNLGNKLCESPCLSNQWCSAKKTAQPSVTTNNGANCGSNGVCANCQALGGSSSVPNSPNCGSVDGPNLALSGASGNANQKDCDSSGICVDPFTCTDNPSCSNPSAGTFTCTDTTTSCANCQKSGACVPCIVDYTSSTCGTLDGGNPTDQPNCRQASRQCVNACADGVGNTDCAGTQGANCMANGVCFNCRDDSDCKTGNGWGGDMGGSTVCENNICKPACASNSNCPANQNCMKTGRCVACTGDADCVSNDGPPVMGTDVVCTAGVCYPPYQCTNTGTPADNQGCATNTGKNNCMADKTCKTCTKDSDCVGDGGFKPNQPKCDIPSGTCVDCGSNDDCKGTGTPLNCDDDGLCRDCRLYPTGVACSNRDGPPGTPVRNLNCDTVTGICVDFCVKDADCTDTCAPKCHLERGCCVECLNSNHCPVQQWRGGQKNYNYCSTDFICTLPPPPPPTEPTYVCETDEDCSGNTPACDFGRQQCVACMADAHCPSGSPACHIGGRRCVDCVDDTYCVNDLDEDGNSKVCSSLNECVAGAGFVSFSLLACLFLALVRLF